MTQKNKCVLLLGDDDFLSNAAEEYCKTLFETSCVVRNSRDVSELPKEVADTLRENDIDYLFNFLSPVRVPIGVIEAVRRLAINFHPAPPDYPGRGCASLALFDDVSEYGATAHIMEQTFDSGEILAVNSFPVLSGDFCDTLSDRALIYTLILFFDVLYELAARGEITSCNEKWSRRAATRKEFDEWMTIRPTDSEEEAIKKIRAVRHRRFPGPYLSLLGERFQLPPRKS